MDYQFPDEETLGKYQALMMAVLVEARALAWHRAPHEQIAELMDAVHNVPDLLSRWPDMDEEIVRRDLARYEEKHCGGSPQFTRILREGPRVDWQLRWRR